MERENILYEIRRCLRIEADSVRKQQEEIEEETILKVTEAIGHCRGKVILSACGTSAMAAKKIAHSLNCIECPALFLTPSDAVHGGLGVVQPKDVVILISKGGNTEELVRLLAEWNGAEMTYAGGIGSMEELEHFRGISGGRLDFTIGSALDLFGGNIPYRELCRMKTT